MKITADELIKFRSNIRATTSRISNADIAQEAANSVRSLIVQQVAVSLLGQPDQEPQIALRLLHNA